MNNIPSRPAAPTPYFDNRHSKSTSFFDQAKIIDFSEGLKQRNRDEAIKYRKIHKKYSENRIDTLDDVLARTLKETEDDKIISKQASGKRKIQTPTVLHPKCINSQNNLHSKSIKSFKQSIHTFSSQQRPEGSLSLKKRSINEHQIHRIASILNSFCNKSVKGQFEQKSKHSITEWVRLVHEMEQNSKKQLNLMQMVNLSKLVLLTQNKIVKIIEMVYDDIVKEGKQSHANHKGEDLSNQFEDAANIIKTFLMRKYKTQKLMKESLANLIYSVEHYLAKWKESKSGCLSIEVINKNGYFRLFQEIICLKYETQDILFCLFSRKIIESLNKNTQPMLIVLTERSACQFLKAMTQNDEQLIEEYHQQLMGAFRQNQQIDMYSFLTLMIKNYKQKRISLKGKQKKETKNGKNESNYHQRVSNNLSFINYEYDQHFWQLEPSNTTYDFTFRNQVEYQAKKLVAMLCNPLPIEYKTFIKELLVIKSIQIIHLSQKFNRKTVLVELGLYERLIPEEQASIYLRSLEGIRNEIFLVTNCNKNKPVDYKIIQKFVKKLLTMPLLSNKLYQLIEYFQKLMQKHQNGS